MKLIRTTCISLSVICTVLSGCKKDALKTTPPAAMDVAVVSGQKQSDPPGFCNHDAYMITLESRTLAEDGNWTWIWSVMNPNPGNGRNGTIQDLGHWGMQFGFCWDISSVVEAAYSGNGTHWTRFPPTYQPDPSQNCQTEPVLKFDFGTRGSARSYYKLVINQEFDRGNGYGYYKSGSRTGCCTVNFLGMACPRQ